MRRAIALFAAVTLGAGALDALPVARGTEREPISPEDLPGLESAPRKLPVETPRPAPPKRQPRSTDLSKSTVVERTAKEIVWANPDGTKTARVFSDPVHYRDEAGDWVPIENSIVTSASGFRNSGGPVRWSFAPDADATELARAAGDNWSIAFGYDGAAKGSRGHAEKSSVLYRGAEPGIDLEYHVAGTELKEMVVLRERPEDGRPPVYRFPLSLSGVTPEQPPGGSIKFYDAQRKLVATIPQGTMTDSAVDPRKGEAPSAPVAVGLAQDRSGWAVTVTPDPAWLLDKDRVYPVYVDPTLVIDGIGNNPLAADAYVSSAAPNTTYNGASQWNPAQGAYVDKVGYYDSSTGENYGYLFYDTTPFWGKQILDATWVGEWAWSYYVSTPTPFRLYPISGPWDTGNITWNTKPSHRAEYEEYTAVRYQVTPVNITEWMVNWAAQTWPSWGMSVDTAGPIQDRWKQLRASENFGNGAHYIEVTYNNPPPMATSSSPADGATFTTTSSRQLAVNPVTDPDGDQVWYRFRVSAAGAVVDSDWQLSPTFVIPDGVLTDGVTYSWTAATGDGLSETWSNWSRTFKVDLRLGEKPYMPFDAVGPVKVNLATGNVVLSTASPKLPTVGGGVGVSYNYNSQTPSPYGLTGSYYSDCIDKNAWLARAADEPELVRRDPQVNFDWIGGAHPGSMISADDFCVRWSGNITVPSIYPAGNYKFGAVTDDGVKITIDPATTPTVVFDRWAVQTISPPEFGAEVSMTPGASRGIQVEYFDHFVTGTIALYVHGPIGLGGTEGEMIVPASWLSPTPLVLPPGWSMSADLDGSGGYSSARTSEGIATLYDPTGASHVFKDTGSGYVSPPEESGTLTKDAVGALTLHADDGITYRFNADGTLASATSAADDRSPAAPVYTWTGTPARLTAITDPVSGRALTLRYGGEDTGCPESPPSQTNLAVAPVGMLCAILYWDGTATRLWYTPGANPQLARIADPGASGVWTADAVEVTDFGYDASGRLTTVRDPLAADALASGVRTDLQFAPCSKTCTVIQYNGTGQATSVRLPYALGDPNETPVVHTYEYLAGETRTHVSEMTDAPAFSSKVKFDGSARVISVTDATGRTTAQEWDANDRAIATTGPTTADPVSSDPTARKSTTIYDADGRPVTAYGPAPASCYTGLVPNGSCNEPVPAETTVYDEGMQGLAAAYWDNQNLTGSPIAHATGVSDPSGRLLVNWRGSSPAGIPTANNHDNWSARYTGKILFAEAGTYTLKLCGDDGVKLWIDDVLLINSWTVGAGCKPTATYNNTAAGAKHRIRIEHFEASSSSDLNLSWTKPSGPTEYVPGANLFPDYGLVTSSIDADGKKTTTEYARPELGLTTASVVDPAGLALRTTTSYDNGADGFLRRLSRTLPAGRQPYRATVMADGPDAYWRLGGTGTAVPDVSGYARDGVSVGVTTGVNSLLPGDGGDKATGFSGSARISLPNRLLQFGAARTVEAWFSASSGAWGPIVGLANVATPAVPTNFAPLLYVGTDGKLRGGFWTGAATPMTSAAVVADGLAHHVVLTSTGSDQTLYLDGAVVGTKSGTVDPLDMINNVIGAAFTSSAWPATTAGAQWSSFAGTIDEVATYTKALTAAQVQSHNTAGRNAPVTTASVHYGKTETRANPCVAGSPAENQAGMPKLTNAPGGLDTEFVYDKLARVVASKRTGDTGWTCLMYDQRGRVVDRVIPPSPGMSDGRTVHADYAVGSNPLVTSLFDSAAGQSAITTTVDLLGRTVSYRDGWAQTTATQYDKLGRVTSTNGPAGLLETAYDLAGRVTAQKLDGGVLATPAYSAATGELASVDYANGTRLSSIGRDGAGRTSALTWLKAGGAFLARDSVVRSAAGRVVDQTVDGTDVHAGDNYAYDGAGRLTNAWMGADTLAYSFADNACAVPNAGRNSNRSSVVDNGVTSTYCYDSADRLASTTDTRYSTPAITYDAHGNTTRLGLQVLGYDSADRHMTTAARSTNISYTRDATDRIVGRTGSWAEDPLLRGTTTGNNGAGAAAVVVNKPAGAVAGDVLLAQVAAVGGTGVAITPPAGWTTIDATANGVSVRSGVYWHKASASEPASYSFGLSVPAAAVAAVGAYYNVDGAAPIHAWSVATGTASTAMTATALNITVESVRTPVLNAMVPATSTSPAAGVGERWDASGTGVAIEMGDRTQSYIGSTGPRTATAAAPVDSVSHLVGLAPATGASSLRYGFSGPGDSPSVVIDPSSPGQPLERMAGLVGGVMLNRRAGSDAWSYPNIHGDVVATAGATGASAGAFSYDPYGQAASAAASGQPDNAASSLDYGWLGRHQRGTEHAKNVATVEMGARQYVPGLGRFLEVDPVEGGSANVYDYTNADSVNNLDLDGTRCWTGVARWVNDRVYNKKAKKFETHKRGICNSISRGAGRNFSAFGRGVSRVAGRASEIAGTVYDYAAACVGGGIVGGGFVVMYAPYSGPWGYAAGVGAGCVGAVAAQAVVNYHATGRVR